MITRIEATQYRCFEQLDVDLSGFDVLVGANGSGKTTLLDIPGLLGEMLSSRTVSTPFLAARDGRAPRASSLAELVFGCRGDSFILAVEAALPDRVIRDSLEGASNTIRRDEARWPRFARYEVRFEIFNDHLEIKNEYLFIFATKDQPSRASTRDTAPRLHGEVARRRSWKFPLFREYGGEAEFRRETGRGTLRKATVSAQQLALPRVQFESALEYPAARWMHELLVEEAVFLRPDWDIARRASPPGLPRRLMRTAANVPWLALQVKSDTPDKWEMFLRHVQVALPQVRDIDVLVRDDDRHAYFVVKYDGEFQVPTSGLSDGTLHIITLSLLPYLVAPPRLLLVEEPENGIHPQAIEAVMQGLSSMYDTQVVVTSHSPVVLATTDLAQILVARGAETGAVQLVRGPEHPRLAQWQGKIDLPTLFAAGVLG
jgi:predicted ATPase